MATSNGPVVGGQCPVCSGHVVLAVSVVSDEWHCHNGARNAYRVHAWHELTMTPSYNLPVPSTTWTFEESEDTQPLGLSSAGTSAYAPYVEGWRRMAAPPKKINEYPHQCPRCGRKAYVGLRTVAHENQPYDQTCR